MTFKYALYAKGIGFSDGVGGWDTNINTAYLMENKPAAENYRVQMNLRKNVPLDDLQVITIRVEEMRKIVDLLS